MKKLVYLAIFILLGYFVFQNWQQKNPPEKGTIVTIGETTYTVEIADTPFLQQHGLSDRQLLAPNAGMLFIFPQKYRHGFWMKDMQFSIDIIWIDDDTIVDFTENLPVPTDPGNLPTFQPEIPVNKVLEVNAGDIKKHNFQIGQKAKIQL